MECGINLTGVIRTRFSVQIYDDQDSGVKCISIFSLTHLILTSRGVILFGHEIIYAVNVKGFVLDRAMINVIDHVAVTIFAALLDTTPGDMPCWRQRMTCATQVARDCFRPGPGFVITNDTSIGEAAVAVHLTTGC